MGQLYTTKFTTYWVSGKLKNIDESNKQKSLFGNLAEKVKGIRRENQKTHIFLRLPWTSSNICALELLLLHLFSTSSYSSIYHSICFQETNHSLETPVVFSREFFI